MATKYYTSLFKQSDVRITTKFSSSHKGIDLSRGVVRQPLYLPNKAVKATVWKILPEYTLNGKLYKNSPIIYLKHKDGQGSRYIHSYPEDVKVKVGDVVKAGQQICCTGASGAASGDHTHYEWLTKWDDLNSRVDPTPFVINDKVEPTPVEPPVDPQPTEQENEINRLKGLIERLEATTEARRAELEQRKLEYEQLQKKYDTLYVERNRFENEKNELMLMLSAGLTEVKTGELIAEIWRRILSLK